MDDLDVWLALLAIPAFDAVRLQQLQTLAAFPDLLNLPWSSLMDAGLTELQAEKLRNPPLSSIRAARQWLQSDASHQLIHWHHPAYPALLREIKHPPIALFAAGDIRLLQTQQVAIVGSRRPTPVGKRIAFDWAAQLSSLGVTITSGLAQGIDASAHQGALSVQGATIAVLGHGLQHQYPKQNAALFQQIRQTGLLVSEYLPDQPPLAPLFPIRNRIVVGLSHGTLVVEAAEKSGSLISAGYAAEYSRELFAVPGSVMNPQAAGCHQLIQQGAKLTRHIADILEELDLQLSPQIPLNLDEKNYSTKALSDQGLLANVGYEVSAIDEIAQRAARPIADVTVALMQLELSGAIAAVPGGYIRVRGPNHV